MRPPFSAVPGLELRPSRVLRVVSSADPRGPWSLRIPTAPLLALLVALCLALAGLLLERGWDQLVEDAPVEWGDT